MRITNTIDTKYLERLLENFEFYKASFELSTDAKVVLKDYNIIRANSAALTILAADPEDIMGKSIFKFLIDYPTNTMYSEISVFNCILLSLNGETYNVSINFDYLNSHGSNMIIATIRDITGILYDKMWLRIKSAAIKAATNAVVITDKHGSILWINPAFTKLTGYTTEDVIDKTPRILKSGKHNEDFYKNIWKTISSGEVWSGEIWNKRKDGTVYLDKQTITPISAFNSEITHYISIKNA